MGIHPQIFPQQFQGGETVKLFAGDAGVNLLAVAGLGPSYGRTLVYFQAIGHNQAVRAFQYVLRKRQSKPLDFHDLGIYGATNYLARGEWRVEVKPHDIQGVRMQLLTAYIPRGAYLNREHYFFITPGEPGVWHDNIFRRWAEAFTPYPIPNTLSLTDVLRYREYDEDADVIVSEGKGIGGRAPWIVAIKPEALEKVLKEVSYAT